jgi:hypothetical protein
MIKSNKVYRIGDDEIKCEIVYGFDPELLTNFTNDDNNALYMFIPRDEYKEDWFKEHENNNINIGVYVIDRLLDDEKQFSKLENVIQKMYKLQDDAYKSIKEEDKLNKLL